MPLIVPHQNYIVTLLQEVDCGVMPQSLPRAWWQEPIGQTQQGIPVYGIPSEGKGKSAVFLNRQANPNSLLDFLEGQVDFRQSGLMMGGVALVDTDTATLLQTNWDLGETEEWEEIAKKVPSGARITHTFSATDLAIDIIAEDDRISLQLLDWEAVPNRLETSRQIEPVHVFHGREKFLSGLQECLSYLNELRGISRRSLQRELDHFLSVRERLG